MKTFSVAEQVVPIRDPDGVPTGAAIRMEVDAVDASIVHMYLEDGKGNAHKFDFNRQGLYVGETYLSKDDEDELVEERLEAAEADLEKDKELSDPQRHQIEAKARSDYKGGARSTASKERQAEMVDRAKKRNKAA